MLNMRIEFSEHLALPCALTYDLDNVVVRLIISENFIPHVFKLLLNGINSPE